jgi:adenylate kinase family enzyme
VHRSKFLRPKAALAHALASSYNLFCCAALQDASRTRRLPKDRLVLERARVSAAFFQVSAFILLFNKDGCDLGASALYPRQDDQPEFIRVRMRACQSSSRPLIHHNRQGGLLISIKADGVPMAMFQRALALEHPRHL